jgi:hypothetical protein
MMFHNCGSLDLQPALCSEAVLWVGAVVFWRGGQTKPPSVHSALPVGRGLAAGRVLSGTVSLVSSVSSVSCRAGPGPWMAGRGPAQGPARPG